jgi:hypothetical protein
MSGLMGQPLIAKLFPYMGELSVSEYWRVIDERNRYRAAFMAALNLDSAPRSVTRESHRQRKCGLGCCSPLK